MGTTPSRTLALAAVTLALVATGASGAAPAQAVMTTPHRMPLAASTRMPPAAVTPLGEATAVGGTVAAATEVVRLVNVARARAGCSPLRVSPRLTTAARLHSQDMAAHSYFSHTTLDGRSPWARIRAQGYTRPSGENIAAGYTTPAAVMRGWMNSPGHRANILRCSSRAIGVGVAKGGSYGTYWTQDFGFS